MMDFELVGGPAYGHHTIDDYDSKGNKFSSVILEIIITHSNCACDWCKEIEGHSVDYYYTQKVIGEKVYIYSRSEESKPQPSLSERVFHSRSHVIE